MPNESGSLLPGWSRTATGLISAVSVRRSKVRVVSSSRRVTTRETQDEPNRRTRIDHPGFKGLGIDGGTHHYGTLNEADRVDMVEDEEKIVCTLGP